MRLADLPGALLRRWYLLLVGLAVTAMLGFVAWQHTPPTYEAEARIVMLPPSKALPAGANPFLALDGLRGPADLVTQYLAGPGPIDAFEEQHPTASYTVGLAVTATNGPVLSVMARDRTPKLALSALESVVAEVPIALADLEKSANTPADAGIGTMVLVKDDVAQRYTQDFIRAMALAVGAGLLSTLFVVFAADGVLFRLRARKLVRQYTPVPNEPVDPGPGIPAEGVDVPRHRRKGMTLKPRS